MTYGVILPIRTFGVMRVYKREAWAKLEGIPRYFVLHLPSNRLLEEFRTKRRAMMWAEQNQNG